MENKGIRDVATFGGSTRVVKSSQLLAKISTYQCAKKVVSDSLGLVDFAIGLVNSVFKLPNGQVMFFEEFE